MGNPVKLKDAGRHQGILLDTNVLPHFLSERHRGILRQYEVHYQPPDQRFGALTTRFSGRLYTSVVNVVECMAAKGPETEIARALLNAFRATVKEVIGPKPDKVLDLYARHSDKLQEMSKRRTDEALAAIETIEISKNSVWADVARGDADLCLLDRIVRTSTSRDRGWADVYTAQTAIEHSLIVLTEDVSDFNILHGVSYLTEYA